MEKWVGNDPRAGQLQDRRNVMINFYTEIRDGCGLAALSDSRLQELARWAYTQVEITVGQELARQLTDAQLDEFEALIDAGEQSAEAWLEANLPDHQVVVQDQLHWIKQEITARRVEILEAAGASLREVPERTLAQP